MPDKPLGQKAYGSIPHLPGSRMGPGEHHCHEGQSRIATVRARDKHDQIWVQEKLDGTCVSVAKIHGDLVPLIRAGYRATESPYEQHHLFHLWAISQRDRFDALLREGERAVGEWLAQAHGTRYRLDGREPFVLFDVMSGSSRLPLLDLKERNAPLFSTPCVISAQPTTPEVALELLGEYGQYGAADRVEGAVWRVERKGAVDFLCKYVRPDKVDGMYLDGVTGGEPVWNWRP